MPQFMDLGFAPTCGSKVPHPKSLGRYKVRSGSFNILGNKMPCFYILLLFFISFINLVTVTSRLTLKKWMFKVKSLARDCIAEKVCAPCRYLRAKSQLQIIFAWLQMKSQLPLCAAMHGRPSHHSSQNLASCRPPLLQTTDSGGQGLTSCTRHAVKASVWRHGYQTQLQRCRRHAGVTKKKTNSRRKNEICRLVFGPARGRHFLPF